MTRILFDQQIFRTQNYGGISRYFAELMGRIQSQPGYQLINPNIYSNNVYLAERKLSRLDLLRKSGNFRGKARIEKFILKKETEKTLGILKTGAFDVFHPTYYDPYFLGILPKNKPFVLTVHDMIHELYFDKLSQKKHAETIGKEALALKASHIIAVSESTKKDLLTYFPGIDEKKISVIYHGAPSFSFNKNVPDNLDLPKRYILFVGLRGDYKNYVTLLENIAGHLKTHDLNLLCAGGGDFNEAEIALINKLGIGKKVHHRPINDDEELCAFYSHAVCFIFPSLFEGFGIPILEAFACNCPVLLINSSCFNEIAGDAALYFKNEDRAGLVKQLDKLQDSGLRQMLIARGLERLKKFSWEQSAAKHIEVYSSLV